MAYETKDNSGSMFIQDKQGNPGRPDFNGKVMVAGVLHWVSGWKNTKDGKEWINLKFQKHEHKEPSGDKEPAKEEASKELDSTIPF